MMQMLVASTIAAALLVGAKALGDASEDGVRLTAQCSYSDGSKAMLTRRTDYSDYFIAHRLKGGGSEMKKVEFGSAGSAQFFAVSLGADGKPKFEPDTDPGDVIAFGRALAYLITQPTVRIGRTDMKAFDEATAVPCPWRTFEESPGDKDLEDVVPRKPSR